MHETRIKMRIPATEEWDRLMNITHEDNAITHWEKMFSLSHDQKFEQKNPEYRATRGFYSARHWRNYAASSRVGGLGFRPAFDNLTPDSLPSDLKDGDIIVAGTLYMDGNPVRVPENPTEDGDIEDYIPDSMLSFGPALDDPVYTVRVIKIGDAFIADRALLKHISYEDIEKVLLSDGHKYSI